MKILNLLGLVFFLAMFSNLGVAQDDMEDHGSSNDESEMDSSSHSEDPGPAQTTSGESESARLGKMGGVELGMGLIVGVVPGSQFHPYYNVMPNLSVGLLYNSGSLDFGSEISGTPGAKINSATLDASIIMIHARYFVGNSFYVSGGLGQRTITADFDIQSTLIDYGIKSNIEAKSTSFMVAIGNQWQWDSGFSLGVEWIGYIVPLSASSSDSLDETGADAGTASSSNKSSVESLKKDSTKLAETIGELSTPRLFMFSLGWSF